MAHGTLLAGIISGVAGKPYGEILRTLLLEPSGLAGTLHGGELPEDVAAEVASVSSGFAAQLQNLGATFSDGLPEHSDGGSGDGRSGTDGTEGSNGADGSDGGDGTATDPPKVGGDAGGSAAADGAPRSSEGRLTGLAGMADAFSHELPLNAGVVNAEALRAGCAPGIGAFGSARDVCTLLGVAARGELSVAVRTIGDPRGVEESTLFGGRIWGRGLQRYDCRGGSAPPQMPFEPKPSEMEP